MFFRNKSFAFLEELLIGKLKCFELDKDTILLDNLGKLQYKVFIYVFSTAYATSIKYWVDFALSGIITVRLCTVRLVNQRKK